MTDLERRLKESLVEVRDAGRLGADARRAAVKQRMFDRMRRRRLLGFAGGALAATAAAVGAFLLFTNLTATPDTRPETAPARIPGPARAVVDVGDGPESLSVGGLRYVWSANGIGNSVSRIDPATNQEILEVDVAARPSDIGIGRGPVWVALPEEGSVIEVHPESGAIVNRVPVADGAVEDIDLGVGANALWAVVRNQHVTRVDAATGETKRFTAAPSPTDIAVKGGLIRLLDAQGVIYQLDPSTGAEVAPRLAVEPHDAGELTFAAGSLWHFAEGGDTVSRLDPATGEVLARVDPEGTVIDFVIDPDVAWVLTSSEGPGGDTRFLLTALDRETTEAIGDPIPVEGEPAAMVIAGKSLWLSLTGEDVVLRFSKYR